MPVSVIPMVTFFPVASFQAAGTSISRRFHWEEK